MKGVSEMKIEKMGFSVLFMWGVAIMACGGGETGSQGVQCASFLPDSLIQGGIERSSEIRTYSGESLFEYIDGGAELYHDYGFVEVATANYSQGQVEVIVDVYGFDTGDHAYGLYASFRPVDPEPVSSGAEGFSTSSTIDFVKGKYVVRVIGFDESAETKKLLESLASLIAVGLPGDDYLPRSFSLFPPDSIMAATDMVYAKSYLGHNFLTDVYARKYMVDSDSLTLFLTQDQDGEKFRRWTELGMMDGSAIPGDADLPFDEGRVFELEHPYYGTIICGLKGVYLLGAVGYRDEAGTFLSKWLHSLP
jgi:hypothetical protein